MSNQNQDMAMKLSWYHLQEYGVEDVDLITSYMRSPLHYMLAERELKIIPYSPNQSKNIVLMRLSWKIALYGDIYEGQI